MLQVDTTVVEMKFFERDAVCPNNFVLRAEGLWDLGRGLDGGG